jgi:hypothetical protein
VFSGCARIELSWGALNDGTPILMIVKALDDAGTGNVGQFVFKFSLFVNVIEAHVNGVRVTQDVIAVRACFFRSQVPRHEHVTVPWRGSGGGSGRSSAQT